MRQALRLILAAAVVLLGLFAQPAASASVDSFAAADVPVYNYDGHPVPIDADGVLSGRGPPAITDDRIARSFVIPATRCNADWHHLRPRSAFCAARQWLGYNQTGR